jgi:hypothetical protein
MEFAAAGCNYYETGFICFSPQRRNLVSSNVIGAAAYYGNMSVLQVSIKQLRGESQLNLKATEVSDAA